MDWLEQNLDAYRIIAEILNELRAMLRPALERIHGPKWFESGIPEAVFKRLVESKERERAIDWYESEYQEIIDYAVFPDILEILEANATSFGPLLQLAPNAALLQARFLELEVMRSKIGRTRPVSDAELSFLGTFHLRFRRAMEALKVESEGKPASRDLPSQKVPPSRPHEAPTKPAPTADVAVLPPVVPPPMAQVEPDIDVDVVDVEAEAPQAHEDAAVPASSEPPPRRPPTAPRPPTRPATRAGSTPTPHQAAASVETKTEDGKPGGLAHHLENGDDRLVLRELYREVTALADSIWSSEVIPVPLVWEQVCVNPWYEQRFSRLGLKPLSDFYEIISKVEQRMSTGVAKDELHALLKEVNFAQVLLALRDMFQRNGL